MPTITPKGIPLMDRPDFIWLRPEDDLTFCEYKKAVEEDVYWAFMYSKLGDIWDNIGWELAGIMDRKAIR